MQPTSAAGHGELPKTFRAPAISTEAGAIHQGFCPYTSAYVWSRLFLRLPARRRPTPHGRGWPFQGDL
jgi:hypothetical protein